MKTLRPALFFLLIVLSILFSACTGATPVPTPTGPPGKVFPSLVQAETAQARIQKANLVPACTPPTANFYNVTSFCANKAALVGGVTFDYSPADGGMYYNSSPGNNVSCSYDANAGKATCSGPTGQVFVETVCSVCGYQQDTTGFLQANLASVTCSKGYAKDADGNCQPTDPSQAYFPCPAGSFYIPEESSKPTYCMDTSVGKPVSDLCPPGTQTYLPEKHYCLPFSYPVVYDCETAAVTLGSCARLVNPATCVKQTCSGDLIWDSAVCSCVNP